MPDSPLPPRGAEFAADLHNARVRYGSRDALDGFDLQVPRGSTTGLLGPNGAGKSTTINVLAGLQKLTAGSVSVLGGAPGRLAAREHIGVMLQDDGLPTGAHAVEIVTHVARLRGRPDTADPLIESLGLTHLGRTTIRRLSGGERRRVSLACALVGDPDLVLLDEPTAGLDQQGRAVVNDLVRGLASQGCAVLLSTHLLDEAEAVCDRVEFIAHGRRLAAGTLAELTQNSPERITFAALPHLDVAALASALPPECTAVEQSPGTYVITGSADPRVLSTVSAWCAQHGVTPTSLTAGRESLTELYWRLMGGAS